MATKSSKRTALKAARAKEEEYSVDEIATLLTATKESRKKADVELPPDNTEISHVENVAELPVTKPKAVKGRGKKAAGKVEHSAENGDIAPAKNNRKRAASAQKEVNGNGDASELPQKKKGRGRKGPITADDDLQENGETAATTAESVEKNASTSSEVLQNGVDVVPKTNKRRGTKAVAATETEPTAENDNAAPVKTIKGRGKKAATADNEAKIAAPDSESKAEGEIENVEPARASRRRGKTPIIVSNETATTKGKKVIKAKPADIAKEAAEEKEPAKPAKMKRNNKKHEVKVEEDMEKKAAATSVKKRGAKTQVKEAQETESQVLKNEDSQIKNNKKVDVEDIPKEVTAKKSRNNKKKEQTVVTTHVTADEEPEQEVIEKKSRKRAAPMKDDKDEDEAATSKYIVPELLICDYNY